MVDNEDVYVETVNVIFQAMSDYSGNVTAGIIAGRLQSAGLLVAELPSRA